MQAARPKVLLSHPTGNQNVRNALRSLVEHEMLAEFWTTVTWDLQSPWNRLLPSRLRTQLARRSFSEAPAQQVKSAPFREAIRLGARSTPGWKLLCTKERPFSIIGVHRHLDGRVARQIESVQANLVYSYEGEALQSFREAKRLGITTCYEVPSSYWHWEQNLFSDEARRNPQFAGLLPQLKDPAGHIRWKDEELALADYVFVPSEHVRGTLRGVVDESKIRVITYGAPLPRSGKRTSLDGSRPLKVLFVGSLHQRKGIGYLIEAVDLIRDRVELTLVGRRYAPNLRVDEACSRWRWIQSVPHSMVLELMQESDVLVLPSLAEGCALVVAEALACGLPVIVTPNTGTLSFVQDGREGFVVPICDADAIADRLHRLDRDRELLAEMSRQAQKTAAQNSWESYRARWADAVRSVSWR